MEEMTGCGWQGPSAIAAWNAQRNQHRKTRDYLKGDAVWFAPAAENEYYGHVGIVTGDDLFTSVTYNGVQTYPISTWGAPYLGWVRFW